MNGPYRLTLKPRAQRDLDRFTGEILQRLREAINELSHDPRGRGTKKLKVSDSICRKRCGNYRILYEIDDAAHEVVVHRVGDRKDVY